VPRFHSPRMKQLRKTLVRKTLTSLGWFPTKPTKEKDLSAFIARLHPVVPRKPLVRLGPPGDGGYLMPDDLEGVHACFSPGVAGVCGFELACADKGMQIFMADASVEAPPQSHPSFRFTRKFIGATTNDTFMTLDQWVADSGVDNTRDLLLQIDIEGAEYETFLATSDALLRRFRYVVAELHDLDLLFSRPFFNLASRAFAKLLQTHACVHIHPNNCRPVVKQGRIAIPKVAEFTFARRDRVEEGRWATTFPHPLDADNTPHRHVALPACWHVT